LFVSTSVNAQKKSRKMIKADLAFSVEQYNKAAELYKKAYQSAKSRAIKSEIIFKQAECYRLSGNKKRAESYYKRAIKAKYPDVLVYLRYADILRMNEKYLEAKEQYQKYIQLNPTDVSGEMGLKSCDYDLSWLSKPTRYQVELMPLINTRFSDFSPSFGNGEYSEVFFTSSRSGGFSNKIDDRTGETFTDIYSSKLNKKGKWSVPTMLAEPINSAGNEGSVVLNKRGTTMYFTKCDVQKKKSLGCNIYVSNRKGKVWSPPTILQIKVDSNTTLGHPTISEDEMTLIFSSDLSGGYGGKDLWIVKKQKKRKME
jgi:peptidoglycan-associated lipoprotein